MTKRNLHTAVVTGPTGAIGMALCRRLLTAGMTVYAVCRPGSPRAAALPQHPALYRVDCDAAALDTLPERLAGRAGEGGSADAFFHLAWAHTIGPGRNDMPAQIENIRHTVMAVRAGAKLGCRVFVGVGSQAEYGRTRGKLCPDTPAFPETGYGMAKLCAGQMARAECRALGMAGIWTRVLSVYGPHDGPRHRDHIHHPAAPGGGVSAAHGGRAAVGLSLCGGCGGCPPVHGTERPRWGCLSPGQRQRVPAAEIYGNAAGCH